MTESLKSFFDNLPRNHWSSIVIAVLSVIFIVYSIYFYFSKEGKDERGKKIISTASFISFIITVILISILNNFSTLFEIVSKSHLAFNWILNFFVLVISGVEAIGILILKNIK
ncbi:hypothetical protein UAY_00514 [Enterococcus moraviensis ATCC BAA-383]|uniref:Uncharacterized protein n=1 Tax=Enterococcus moraviensis ATCC BAA-383 TaxID=1158609 RepID=R2R7Z5_9ENTE|nr:hypothetical protein [Enterococcus moraviensis]EOI05040.1 hypothetical protein UAY_00514 [Enterococcus moraviensis ATCC BAA-383]EOT63823.1 hypothetical protein I586_03256 [Enterococcus moraviensis ATCC BAA-383]OJG67045.1 hypothetical protein RV09_GL002954 [Enterococcus moraviensis]